MLSIDSALERLGFARAKLPMTTSIRRDSSIPVNSYRRPIETNLNSPIKPRSISIPPNNKLLDSRHVSAFASVTPSHLVNSQPTELRSRPRIALKPKQSFVSRASSNIDTFKRIELVNEAANNSQALRSRSISHSSTSFKTSSIMEASPFRSIESHKLNVDHSPIVIRKKPLTKLNQIQNVSLKFLRPIEPPEPGEITIIKEPDVQAAPMPPKIIREKPPLAPTPPPIIIREKPPKVPEHLPEKHVVLPGRTLPPPPRQVIVEILPQIPAPPPDLFIERWLGFKRRIRRVIFNAPSPVPLLPNPKNEIIEWLPPKVILEKKKVNLGVEICDPNTYIKKHGPDLVNPSELPDVAREMQPPPGCNLAINSDVNKPPTLIGDLKPLKLLCQTNLDIKNFLDKLNLFTLELNQMNLND
jgi:hypothetical protein